MSGYLLVKKGRCLSDKDSIDISESISDGDDYLRGDLYYRFLTRKRKWVRVKA